MMSGSRDVTKRIIGHRIPMGAGIAAMRALPLSSQKSVGPFILLDHVGPYQAPLGEGAEPHCAPYAGMESVTLQLEGVQEYADSMGNRVRLRPGDAQWTRAGRGIVQAEMPASEPQTRNGRIHSIKLWLDVPPERRSDAPDFRCFRRDDIPTLALGDATGRVLAGHICDTLGPLVSYTPLCLLDVALDANQIARLPIHSVDELAVYVVTGSVRIGSDRTLGQRSDLLLTGAGGELVVEALSAATVLVLGGATSRDPYVRQGSLVMNSFRQIDAAEAFYYRGGMGHVGRHFLD